MKDVDDVDLSEGFCCPACGYPPIGMSCLLWDEVCPVPICQACAATLLCSALWPHVSPEEASGCRRDPLAELARLAGRSSVTTQSAIIAYDLDKLRRLGRGGTEKARFLEQVLEELAAGRPHVASRNAPMEFFIPAGSIVVAVD